MSESNRLFTTVLKELIIILELLLVIIYKSKKCYDKGISNETHPYILNQKETMSMEENIEKITEIEAATFRRLKDYLAKNTQVQNIDLMDVGGFCRNCLARWYQEESIDRNMELSKDEARELFYGMPYNDWKDKHQT